jgi:hypothetical protein
MCRGRAFADIDRVAPGRLHGGQVREQPVNVAVNPGAPVTSLGRQQMGIQSDVRLRQHGAEYSGPGRRSLSNEKATIQRRTKTQRKL